MGKAGNFNSGSVTLIDRLGKLITGNGGSAKPGIWGNSGSVGKGGKLGKLKSIAKLGSVTVGSVNLIPGI